MTATILEFVIVLAAILLGARQGGLAIGYWGGLGLVLLAVIFGVTPTAPPVDVMLIIMAVCMSAAAMDAAGGLEFLVRIAARIIRSNPKYVSIIAPLVGFFLTFFSGTGNLIFAIHPVIYEVAYSAGVRPERPMASATVAAQIGITACPISAATAALLGLFAAYDHAEVTLSSILMVTFPACLIGVLAGSFIYMFWGKELKDDPEYQRRLKAGLVEPPEAISDQPLPKGAKLSVGIFLLGVFLIVLTGFFPELRTIHGKPVSMSLVIEMVMLAGAALMVAFCHVNLDVASKSPTLRAGVVSVGAIFGIAWLADSFIGANKGFFMELAGDLAAQAPWLFAFVLFFMSALLTSQGATTRAIMPLGLTLGIPVPLMIAMFPAVNGLFFLPITGPALSAVSFDRSGTTKIGKYILNHSFQIPGIVMVVVSVVVAMLLTQLGL